MPLTAEQHACNLKDALRPESKAQMGRAAQLLPTIEVLNVAQQFAQAKAPMPSETTIRLMIVTSRWDNRICNMEECQQASKLSVCPTCLCTWYCSIRCRESNEKQHAQWCANANALKLDSGPLAIVFVTGTSTNATQAPSDVKSTGSVVLPASVSTSPFSSSSVCTGASTPENQFVAASYTIYSSDRAIATTAAPATGTGTMLSTTKSWIRCGRLCMFMKRKGRWIGVTSDRIFDSSACPDKPYASFSVKPATTSPSTATATPQSKCVGKDVYQMEWVDEEKRADFLDHDDPQLHAKIRQMGVIGRVVSHEPALGVVTIAMNSDFAINGTLASVVQHGKETT